MYSSKNLLKNLKLPPFLKNVFTLSFGSVISQVISFIALPILGRLYEPIEYGLYTSFLSVCQFIIIFSTLKYEKTIILPKNKKKSEGLVLLTLLIVTFYSILVLITIAIFYFLDFKFYGISNYIFYIPLTTLSFGYLSIITNWNQREERYLLISIITVIQVSLTLVISLFFGKFKYSLNGLIIGWVYSSILLVIGYTFFNQKRISIVFNNFNKAKLVYLFKKYINFPKYYLLYDILNMGTIYFVPLIISYIFSSYECGLFSMAYRILMVPFIVISTSVSNVFIVKANKSFEKIKKFNGLYKNLFQKIVLIGLVIYLTSFLIGGKVINIFLGNKWADIDLYIKVLSIWMFFEFTVTVFKSNTYIIVQKQKFGLVIQTINSITSILCLVIFSKFGIQKALIAFTISMSFFSILNLLFTYHFSKNLTKLNILSNE